MLLSLEISIFHTAFECCKNSDLLNAFHWDEMDLYVPVIVYVVMVSSFTFSYASSILWLSDRLQAKIAVWLQYILYKFPFIYNALVAMNKLFYILDNLINWCRNVIFFFFYFQLHVFISCSTLLPLWKIILSYYYQMIIL